MPVKVLFHSYGNNHCLDGFSAAYCAYTLLGDAAQYIPVTHLTKEEYAARLNLPEINKNDLVYILDFAYPAEIIQEWVALGANIILLDHHEGNQTSLVNLSYVSSSLGHAFTDGDNLNKIYFDLTRSGAEIAWEYFQGKSVPAPDLIRYVGDRDTWKKALPHSEEVHRALSTFPQDFEVWDTLAYLPNYVSFMTKIGAPIWQAHCEAVDELIKTAEWKELLGYKVLCTNTDNYSLVSDALNKICREHPETPFAVNYRMVEGKLKFEFRSVGEFSVRKIANQLSGGGHIAAAGALVDLSGEYAELVEEFLA